MVLIALKSLQAGVESAEERAHLSELGLKRLYLINSTTFFKGYSLYNLFLLFSCSYSASILNALQTQRYQVVGYFIHPFYFFDILAYKKLVQFSAFPFFPFFLSTVRCFFLVSLFKLLLLFINTQSRLWLH